MLFTDALFLFYFLPASLLLARILAGQSRLTNAYKASIVGATILFYAYENWLWVLVFSAVVGSSYLGGLLLAAAILPGRRRFWLVISISAPLLLLGLFKYLNWLADLLPVLVPARDRLLPWFGSDGRIALPPGISFYVFEAISYSIDIYRRKIIPPKNPLDFLSFIAMFPRFIAGPIVRYADLETQIRNWAGMKLAQGLTLFAIGFSMKCLFADQFAIFVPYAFKVPEPDFLQAWGGVLSYTFQLYFDFWSYSIMATGLGVCLGFEFPDNFRSPYHAASITQFWRQWHISLSTWLRDYLYISLGGSRCKPWRTHANLLLTMLLGGIWHGANSTFAIWGLYHGLLLAMERWIGEARLARSPLLLRRAITLALVIFGWTVFRSEDLTQARSVFTGMLGFHSFNEHFNVQLLHENAFAFILVLGGLTFCVFGERLLVTNEPIATREFPMPVQTGIFLLFCVALLVAFSSSEIPFLYFQF